MAQVSTVLLAAAAGALAFTKAPGNAGSADATPHEAPLQILPSDAVPTEDPTLDFTLALGTLNDRVLRVEQPRNVAAADPPKPKAEEKPDPVEQVEPQTTQVTLQYLGYIVGPKKSRAYLGDEAGRHFLVAEGQEHDGVTVVTVSMEKVVVRDSAGERELNLEVRPENQVPNGSSGAFGSAVPAMPGVGPDRLPQDFLSWPPEEQARYRENMARQQIESQRRNNKPGATPIRPPARPVVPGKQLEKEGEKQPGSLS